MKITLKDNVVAEVTRGTTVLGLAESISPSIAKNVLCGRVNGALVDLNQEINKNCKLELITKSSEESKVLLNHTASHILAQAVKSIFPSCKLVEGGGDYDGFYYDFDFKTSLQTESLSTIEAEVNTILKAGFVIEKEEVPRYEAIIKMSEFEEPYKIESLELGNIEDVGVVKCGDFVDLCSGAHLQSTKLIKRIILTKFSEVTNNGEYFGGGTFTRIEGKAFFSENDYDDYLSQIKKSKFADHKVIGETQQLFVLNDYGSAVWLPDGVKLKSALVDFLHEIHSARGYLEINSPIIEKNDVYQSKVYTDFCKTSNYKLMKVDENRVVKPINCPSAMLVYKLKQRTKEELPIKISECGVLHRDIQGSELNGLLVLSEFTQDDAHIFLTKDQIKEEFFKIFDCMDVFYSTLGLQYSVELATRPMQFIGERKVWTETETLLKNILSERFGEGFSINKGKGSYFAPEVNILVKDSNLNIWKTGSIKLDVQLPKKFNLQYAVDKDNFEIPVVIHRTMAGSIERIIALIIENCVGEFPFWLAPTQVRVQYSSKRNLKVAERVQNALHSIKIRANLEQIKKPTENLDADTYIPYTIFIDSNMVKNQSVMVAVRGRTESFEVPIKKFLEGLDELNKTRMNNLYYEF